AGDRQRRRRGGGALPAGRRRGRGRGARGERLPLRRDRDPRGQAGHPGGWVPRALTLTQPSLPNGRAVPRARTGGRGSGGAHALFVGMIVPRPTTLTPL